MGRLTEINGAISVLAVDINQELSCHIDLRKHNQDIIEARREIKRRKKNRQLDLFDDTPRKDILADRLFISSKLYTKIR